MHLKSSVLSYWWSHNKFFFVLFSRKERCRNPFVERKNVQNNRSIHSQSNTPPTRNWLNIMQNTWGSKWKILIMMKKWFLNILGLIIPRFWWLIKYSSLLFVGLFCEKFWWFLLGHLMNFDNFSDSLWEGS